MVIYSSSLCKDVAFELIPAPDANKIDCRLIVTDEMYERSKSPGPEAIEGEAGSGVIQDSTEQIKFKQSAEDGTKSPLDKASQEGPNLHSAFKEMAALVEQAEAELKPLEEILAEIDPYFESLFGKVSDIKETKQKTGNEAESQAKPDSGLKKILDDLVQSKNKAAQEASTQSNERGGLAEDEQIPASVEKTNEGEHANEKNKAKRQGQGQGQNEHLVV